MNKIIITGGTSFLGSNLVNFFSKNKDNTIYCLVRKNSKNIKNIDLKDNVKIIYCDLNNLSSININENKIDWFFHFAWFGKGGIERNNEKIQEDNFLMSKEVLRFAHSVNTEHFVFSGSQAEYGISERIKKEDDICRPISQYGKAKLRFKEYAEGYSLENNIKYIHLRIFSVYGIGDHPTSLINSSINAFLNNESIIYGPCTQIWNYLYIDDFVKIIDLLMKSKKIERTNIINIASNDNKILREYLIILKEIIGCNNELIFNNENPNPEGLANLNPSIEKLISIIGNFKYISFENAIKKIINNRCCN